MAEMDMNVGGVTLRVIPQIDWSALHGELAKALSDEAKHIMAAILRRKCPVCFK